MHVPPSIVSIVAGSQILSGSQQSAYIDRLRKSNSPTERSRIEGILVSSVYRMILRSAMKYSACGLDVEDLFQEGCKGAVEAIRKYDTSRNAKLSSYMLWHIKKCMTSAISDQKPGIRIPRSLSLQSWRAHRDRERYVDAPSSENVANGPDSGSGAVSLALQAPQGNSCA